MSTQLPPEGISQSAWDAVRAILALHSYAEQPAALARAIDAATARERERCAKLADQYAEVNHELAGDASVDAVAVNEITTNQVAYGTAARVVSNLAAAIRQGSQPSNAIPLKGVVR